MAESGGLLSCSRCRLTVVHAVELVFGAGWAGFWMYWLVAAFSMKRGHVPWSRELGIRAAFVVIVFLLVRLGAFRGAGVKSDPWRGAIGLVLFGAGLSFRDLGPQAYRTELGYPHVQEERAGVGEQRLPMGGWSRRASGPQDRHEGGEAEAEGEGDQPRAPEAGGVRVHSVAVGGSPADHGDGYGPQGYDGEQRSWSR